MPHSSRSVQPPLHHKNPASGESQPPHATVGKLGKVILVGAGPGDPGLITVRGAERLAQADVVLYDALANPKLLQLAPQADQISVGKHGHGPLWTQHEINARLVEIARSGRTVVRLKGGDTGVFARTAEELEAVAASGIPFEVVPGVTAALAVASYTGIPLTHRDHASAVAFITGRQQDGDANPEIDWDALARFPGTLVFYMGVTTASQWSHKLIAAGKPAHTAAAIVRRCSWSDQRVIRTTLGRVADELTPSDKLRPPVLTVIGEVAALGREFSWFEDLPLLGQGILLTRPDGQNDEAERELSALGAEVYIQPALEIRPVDDFLELDKAIVRLASGHYRGIAFTSSNAIDAVVHRLEEHELDLRVFAGTLLAVVGSKTAEHLKQYGLRADIVPEQFSAAGLIAKMKVDPDLFCKSQAWLLPQADRAAETLTDGLTALGATVDRVTAYRSLQVEQLSEPIHRALSAGRIHWVLATSPAGAESIAKLLEPYLSQLQFLSLSPAITEKLVGLGITRIETSPIPTLPEAIRHLRTQAKNH